MLRDCIRVLKAVHVLVLERNGLGTVLSLNPHHRKVPGNQEGEGSAFARLQDQVGGYSWDLAIGRLGARSQIG